jgi:thioredoxin-dependent peroxiredoxin
LKELEMEGTGTVVGMLAPDFSLPDPEGKVVTLSEACKKGPVLLAFYPGDFTAVCTKQLCNYRDNFDQFGKLGVQVLGISHNDSTEHKKFASQYSFPFPLLTDSDKTVARRFACTSIWMLNQLSRAVFVVNKDRVILYRYVEPTVLTHRSTGELVGVLESLKKAKLI